MEETLYLIDGHAQIFRAFYAIRSPMTSPVTGEPTNAVFAFTGMLLKLFEKFRPHYVVMAIDTPGKTFRDEMYPEYKAHRAAPPDELVAQIPRIFEVARLFGIVTLGQEGAEADDVIATVTRRLLNDPTHGRLQVRVVSKDKDLEQLLGQRVSMFDIQTDTLIDVAGLKADKGIEPGQVVDVLALTGDTVDNVPGVVGIGPKTAAQLISRYGSIEGILSHLDEIKGKRRENLEKARGFLPTARALVKLKDDLPIEFDLGQARVGPIDAGALKHLFKELGFRRHLTDLERILTNGAGASDGHGKQGESPGDEKHGLEFAAGLFDVAGTQDGAAGPRGVGLVAEVIDSGAEVSGTESGGESGGGVSGGGVTTAKDFEYEMVGTAEELREVVETAKKQEMVSVDTETIGLGHRAMLCGVSLAWREGHGVYIPMRSPAPGRHLAPRAVLEGLRGLLEDPGVPKCGHNIKYDILVLKQAGVHVRGVAFDSMIASHILDLPGHGLDDLSLSLLRHETIPISRLIGVPGRGVKQKTMDEVALEEITPYAAEDADMALRLYEKMRVMLTGQGAQRLAEEVEFPLIEVLVEMQEHGIRVEPAVLARQKLELAERIEVLRGRIQGYVGAGVNVDSPKQLGQVLFGTMGLPVVKRTKTGPSTDNEVLERLCEREDLTEEQAAVPRLLIEYRQLTKLVNTYLDNLRDSIDPKTGRVHATFNQTGAATGRLSSTDPNLQNIPIRTEVGRQIRRAFVADPGPPRQVLISADYSQIELRILAHLSEDPALIEAFERGEDIHKAVAGQVFGVEPGRVTAQQRGQAKTINFGIIYGVTAYGLARRIENLDLKAAQELITAYRARFAGIDRFLERCVEQAKEQGWVATILGRRRHIPQVKSSSVTTRNLGERLAINTVVQGSAADLIKLAMVNLHRRIHRDELALKLLLQIHDELVLETPEKGADAMAEVVRQEMEGAMKLRVPLKVDVSVGADWFAAK